MIPSFNQGMFIEEAVRAVLLQGYPDLELIIIDGASTDNTLEVIGRYSPWIAHAVSEPDRGQSHALNKGFSRATGSMMAWICADDLYLPGALSRTAHFFAENDEAEFVYGDGAFINEKSQIVSYVASDPRPDPRNFHNHNYVFSTTAFWKRALWIRSGGYIDESNHWTMDWELFIRMSRCARLHHDLGTVACLRHHENTKTFHGLRADVAKRRREIVRVSRKYGGPFCYNSVIYCLMKIASFADVFKGMPKPIYSIAFRLLHIPILMSGRGRKSIFFNGFRDSSGQGRRGC